MAPYTNADGDYEPSIAEDPDYAVAAPYGDWSLPEGLRFAETDAYELEASYIMPPLNIPDSETGPVGSARMMDADEGADGEGAPEARPYSERALAAFKEQLMAGRPVEVSINMGEVSVPEYALYNTGDLSAPHAVCVVGWDDDYPAENFPEGSQPPGNGAFIVKNSWGSLDSEPGNRAAWGVDDSGYFYLSYYDRTINAGEAFDFVTDADADVNRGPEGSTALYHHQHNFLPASGHSIDQTSDVTSMANVFEFDEPSAVQTIGFTAPSAIGSARFDVYLLDEGATEPTDGELVASRELALDYGGFRRVELDDPILVGPGDRIGVVLTASDPETGYWVFNPVQNSELMERIFGLEDGTVHYWGEAHVNEGESFFGSPSTITTFNDGTTAYGDYRWQDLGLRRAAQVAESERALEGIWPQIEQARSARSAAYREWQSLLGYDPDGTAAEAAEERFDEATSELYELVYSVPTDALTEVDNYAITLYATDYDPDRVPAAETVDVARLYRPSTGEHLFTTDARERASLVADGWTDEGSGWTAPARSDVEVWRLCNPYTGEHLYTYDAHERSVLTGAGWRDEGLAFHSDRLHRTEVYRLYNEHAPGAAAHHFTTSAAERDQLVELGWHAEGIAWYGA